MQSPPESAFDIGTSDLSYSSFWSVIMFRRCLSDELDKIVLFEIQASSTTHPHDDLVLDKRALKAKVLYNRIDDVQDKVVSSCFWTKLYCATVKYEDDTNAKVDRLAKSWNVPEAAVSAYPLEVNPQNHCARLPASPPALKDSCNQLKRASGVVQLDVFSALLTPFTAMPALKHCLSRAHLDWRIS